MKRKKLVTLLLAVVVIVIVVSLVSCNSCGKAAEVTGTPEPEVTATPEAVESPEANKVTAEIENGEEVSPDPTATVEPTAEPTAEPVVAETATAAPTAAPVAGNNQGTTPTQQPQAPQATATPAPAAKPTEAPKPTATPKPTEKPSTPQPTEKPAETHTHDWQDVTKTVHHDAVTEERWVVDTPASDPWVEYTERTMYTCRCGTIFPNYNNIEAHQSQYISSENFSNHSSFSVDTVYDEIYHEGAPEVGHYETVIVTAAWDETVVTGQKCTTCGATK